MNHCSANSRGLVLLVIMFCHSALGATDFSESFAAMSLPATLEESSCCASVSFATAAAVFPGVGDYQRVFLRSVEDDFHTTSFVLDVTVTLANGFSGAGTAFVGLGRGEPLNSFYDEPRDGPHLFLRVFPDDINSGTITLVDNRVEVASSANGAAGEGTHRVRMIWDAVTGEATFQIHQNYTGGSFVASTSIGPLNGGDNGFTNTDTRVFFGGASGISFDDLSVISAKDVNITSAGTGSGDTDGDGAYQLGSVVNLTATPMVGSRFTGWSGDAICAASFIMPATAVNCTATFTLNTYTFATSTSGPGSGNTISSTADGTYDYNTIISLAASADSGSVFNGWSPAECVDGFNLTANTICTANFILEPDQDFDGFTDSVDNCPADYNPSQADSNDDGIGNVCDFYNICNGPDVIIEGTIHVDNVYCADETSITSGGAEPTPGSVTIDSFGNVIYTAPHIVLIPGFNVESGAMFRAGNDIPAQNQCSDDCTSVNAICEDGGPGAVANSCLLGTDCTDCGLR